MSWFGARVGFASVAVGALIVSLGGTTLVPAFAASPTGEPVVWSGRMVTSDGVLASGLDVSACRGQGCTAPVRTGADGSFAIPVESLPADAPEAYRVEVERVAGVRAQAGGLALPVFRLPDGPQIEVSADTQDIILPPMAKVTTHVTNATGDDVAGAEVRAAVREPYAGVEGGSGYEGELTDVAWTTSAEGDGAPATVTDSNGEASFYSFVEAMSGTTVEADLPYGQGQTLTVFRSLNDVVNTTPTTLDIQGPDATVVEADTDGVPAAVENAVPSLNGGGTGDGNGDGLPDSEQVNVTSLQSASDQWVTLKSPTGTELSNVSSVNLATVPAPPANMVLPEGLTNFVVNGIPDDSRDQTITIFTTSTAGLSGYAKYDAQTGWSMLPANRVVIVDDHRVEITLTDGGAGDADGVVNGSILDPGGLVFNMYRFDGFAQPINDESITPGIARSVFKAGSTVPVKIQLKNLDGTIATPSAAPIWLAPQKGSAISAAANEQVWTETVTSGVDFERTGDTWHYNWSTKGYDAGYTYRLRVKLDDGTTRSVIIALK